MIQDILKQAIEGNMQKKKKKEMDAAKRDAKNVNVSRGRIGDAVSPEPPSKKKVIEKYRLGTGVTPKKEK